jgi:Na+/H+ antiporter NhaD/arsenite permease-like protein
MIRNLAAVPHSHWIPIGIFAITYLLIAIESTRGSHLDRTAAAFCGAVAMVLAGVISLEDSYRAVDWNTIIFLLGMMILVAHFQLSGFFDWIALHIAKFAGTRLQLLIVLVFTAGILSAFFVNDTICLIFTPIILSVTQRLRLAPLPYVLALATSSNIGSTMSVTGNPQNAFIGVTAHFSFLGFLGHLAPVALLGLALNAAILVAFFRRDILGQPLPQNLEVESAPIDRPLLWKSACTASLIVVLWILGFPFPLVAISVGAFILIIGRVRPANVYQRLDWELLLFFASLFVLIRGFETSGATAWVIEQFRPWLSGTLYTQVFGVSGIMLALSNLVSNVPAVLVFRPIVSSFRDSHFIWLVVASSSTLAGNAIPISSVANLIVLQQANKQLERPISFWEFARVGVVVTFLTTLLAAGILILEARLLRGA